MGNIFLQTIPSTAVPAGTPVTLQWVATGASSLTSNELGNLPLSGSMVLTLEASNYYHFLATNGVIGSWSFHDYTTPTSWSFTIPTALAVDDQVMIALEMANGAGTPSDISDSLGNTLDQISAQSGGGDTHEFALYNIAVTNPGTSTISMDFFGPRNVLAHIVLLRGVGAIQTTSPDHNIGFSLSWASEPITPVTVPMVLLAFDVAYGPPAVIDDSFQSLQSGLVPQEFGGDVQLDTAVLTVAADGTYTSSWSQDGPSNEWITSIVGFPTTATTAVIEVLVGDNRAAFNLQKTILTMKQDRIPVRGKN